MIPNETDMNLKEEWWPYCEFDDCSHWSHAVCKPEKFPHIWGTRNVEHDDSSFE